jgi:hypothetical protein
LICNPLGIGEHGEGPAMMLLIWRQPVGLGKRNDDDPDTAPIELILGCFHLAEVMLARQSGEVPEKN